MFIIRFISDSKKDMLRRKVSFPGAITVGGQALGRTCIYIYFQNHVKMELFITNLAWKPNIFMN